MKTFKRTAPMLAAAAVIGFSTGCANKTQEGALIGTGIGALAGQAIGGDTGGTLLGAAAGAIIGGAIGNNEDEKDKERQEVGGDQ